MPWEFAGERVESVKSWQYRAGTLNVQVRVLAGGAAYDAIRGFSTEAGDVEQIVDSVGDIDHIETDLEPTPMTVSPPEAIKNPPLRDDDFFVQSYNESPGDDGSIWYDVQLSLRREDTRHPFEGDAEERYGHFRYGYFNNDDVLNQTPSTTDDWVFGFRWGKLAVPNGDVSGGEKRARTDTLALILDPVEAAVILNNLGTSKTVEKRDVPDGDDYYIDHHPKSRNSVDVVPPDSGQADDYIHDGEYAVSGWMLQRKRPLRFEARLSLGLVDRRAEPGAYGGSRWGYFNYGEDTR